MKFRKLMQFAVLLTTITATGALLADRDGSHDDDHGSWSERLGWGEKGSKGEKIASNGLSATSNAAWKKECGSCHLAFNPGMLPERSWRKMMSGLESHFGENASLDPKTAEEITRFLVENSADQGGGRRSSKIAQSISASSTPLRITETSYFIRKHDEVRASVFQRKSIGSPANCAACHKGAEQGDFSEHNVSIPK